MAEQRRRRSTEPMIMPGSRKRKPETVESLQSQFEQVAEIIRQGRHRAYVEVNAAVIGTYWSVGKYISEKVRLSEWGEGVVEKLAIFLETRIPDTHGFNRRGLYRMKQFYEAYADNPIVSPLVTQIQWSNHLVILSGGKTAEKREFYIRCCARERWTKRELERQIAGSLFERAMVAKPKLSPPVRVLHPGTEHVFRDSYSLGFLGLPDDHSESDLRQAIVRDLKRFIIEFGRDFAFVGEHYRLQVGTKDFFVDLLFYHRELRCLVAFELKIQEFKPEHLGQVSFYLEALDRDVKKPHENPSIGIILCKGKESEVVEYALSRTTSPAAIADYWTKLPDKGLLQDKLHELFDSSVREVRTKYGD